MTSRNVDLLIRARDNASRAFKSVSDALDELGTVQVAVAAKADKVDTAFTKSQTAAKKVASALGGDVTRGADKAAAVFERIERTVSESTAQLAAQKAELDENKAAYSALGKQAAAAATAIARSESKIGPKTEEQSHRLKAMKGAYTELTLEVGKTTPKLAKQEATLSQNTAELDRVRNAAIAASGAMREVARAAESTRNLTGQKTQTAAANAAAAKGISTLAKAERAIQIEIAAREDVIRSAAAAEQAANQQIIASVNEIVASERRLLAIQAQRAKMATASVANNNAAAGLAGITAGLISKERAETAAARASAAHSRAMDALNASYARQRAASRPSVQEQAALAAAFRKSFAAAQSVKSPLAQVFSEVSRLGPASNQAADGVRRLTGQMLSGRRAFSAFYGDSRKALSLMQRLRGEVLSATASFVGFYAIFNTGQGIFESFSKLEAAQNRLGAAFDQDYAKVADEMAHLQSEAARLGISFDVLSDNYSKFLISGQQAGISVDDLRETFRKVSEAGRVLKLSNDQIEGTFNALTQIAGKGTLQMEELRQQLGDRIPGAVGIMASALGYGKDELAKFYKDVENGNVAAKDALVAFGDGLEDTFGAQLEDALDSTITKVGELQNLFFQRQLTAANSGLIDGLDTALTALNEFLASDDGIQFFEQLGAAFGTMFEILPVILENLDTFGFLLKAFVAIKVGQTVAQLGGNLSNLSRLTVGNIRVQVALNRAVASFSPSAAAALRSTTALGVGLRGLRAAAASMLVAVRAAFLSLGGIIGVVATALSFFAVSAMTSVAEESQSATEALEAHADMLTEVKDAYAAAEGSADKFAEKLKDISKIEADANLARLRAELQAFRDDDSNTLTGVRGSRPETRALLQSQARTLGIEQLAVDLMDADKAFTYGEASARGMLDAITAINEATPELLNVEVQARIEKIAKEALAMETAIAEAEATVRLLSGTATEADEVLLGLVEAVEDVAASSRTAATGYTEFRDAMRSLAEQVPSLNDALERLDAIGKIEDSFQNALIAARALPDAIMRIAASQEALKTKDLALLGLDADAVSGFDGTDGAKVAADVLRSFEGFISTPKYDVNAYRVGYGSDTITLSDGTVQDVVQGMSVSVAAANRDLLRRVQKEFLPATRDQVGAEKFDTFNAQQQAALVSIAYNYGSLPDRIMGAVRTGTTEEVASAIQGLGGDNNGVNRGRRNKEAALFASTAGEATAIKEIEAAEAERVKTAEDLLEKQQEFRAEQKAGLADTEFENSLAGKRLIDAEVAKALREAQTEAQKVGLTLTQAELDAVESVTRAKFAVKQVEEDRNAELEKAAALEEVAANLAARRAMLVEQMTQQEAQADLLGLAKSQTELEALDAQLDSAIEKAIAFWQALGGDGAEAAILALQATQQELRNVESTAVTTGKEINTMIGDRAASAVDSFAERIANGENALTAFRDEFLSMAADILREIGLMIVKQLIFNAISGMFGGGAGGGGGLGGVVAGAVNKIFHNGGVVSANSPTSARKTGPANFANAVRYHTGGIVGLAPDEMNATLKKNEEVLTADDPRHRYNGGLNPQEGSGSGAAGMTIINAFDAPGFLEAALSDTRGGKAFVNHIKANSDKIKAALG